jgi:hypothetical protein
MHIFSKEEKRNSQIGTNVGFHVFNVGLLATSHFYIRKFLRSANSIKVFRGFPQS